MSESDLAQVLRVLLWTIAAGHVMLAIRMATTGLYRTYRYFFYYVIFRICRSVALSVVPFQHDWYTYIWLYTAPVLWFLYALLLLELYGLILENYRGLATVGRWAMMIGLGIAALIASLTLGPDLSGTPDRLRYALAVDRGVVSSLILFLFLIAGFLAWYPIKLSRNVIVHCLASACYFAAGAALLFIRNLGFKSLYVMQLANIGLTALTLLCLATWIVFLTRQGETVTVSRRLQWQPKDEEHLMEQLAAINASLLRTARK